MGVADQIVASRFSSIDLSNKAFKLRHNRQKKNDINNNTIIIDYFLTRKIKTPNETF